LRNVNELRVKARNFQMFVKLVFSLVRVEPGPPATSIFRRAE